MQAAVKDEDRNIYITFYFLLTFFHGIMKLRQKQVVLCS